VVPLVTTRFSTIVTTTPFGPADTTFTGTGAASPFTTITDDGVGVGVGLPWGCTCPSAKRHGHIKTPHNNRHPAAARIFINLLEEKIIPEPTFHF